MFNLGCKFLFSRKKWVFLIVFTLAFVISSILSIFTASEAIRAGLLKKAYSHYGEHSGALIGVEISKKDLEREVEKIGAYQLVDSCPLGSKKIVATIGWMDEDAINIGNIKIVEGRFPKEKDEVAIESAYLNLIDSNWKIGETKTLKGKNQQWKVKLVGIVSNYSSKWYVPIHLEQGVHAFPNIFIGSPAYENLFKYNYLIKMGDDKKTSIEKMENLLDEYHKMGFVNDKLFQEGLKDYDIVRYLSIVFQSILLLISIFSITSIFTYFNRKQMQKIGILKAIGVKNTSLYVLYFSQVFILFLSSLVMALPIHYVFKSLIIRMSYKESLSEYPDLMNTYMIIIACIAFLFVLVLFIACWPLIRSKHSSIKSLMTGTSKTPFIHTFIERKIKTFEGKQLARQLFLFPKQFVYTVSIISISILMLVFSIVLQKESDGIWDADEYYYLCAQELYGFKTVDNLPVLLKQRLTFSEEDAMKLRQLPGVKHVEKTPFMVDVVPLVDDDQKSYIHQWLNKNGPILTYDNKWIVPNVKYVIIDEKEFHQIDPKGNYDDFKGKIMLFIPNEDGTNDININGLIGEKISFVKLVKEDEDIRKIEKEYFVYDAKNQPLIKHVNGMKNIEYDHFTIVFDKDTIEESNLFNGYYDFIVYLNKDITDHEFKKIDDYVNQLIATVPGSLFQNIPEFIEKETRITSLLSFLGKFSFVIASLLTVLSITIIVFSKYQLQRRDWGIYLSLGMSKRKIYYFLTAEMFVYYILASIISFIVFILVLLSNHLDFSISYYFIYFLFSLLFMFLLIMMGSFLLFQIINKKSIFSMLREVE
jgi:putative ABC transport system permease protein